MTKSLHVLKKPGQDERGKNEKGVAMPRKMHRPDCPQFSLYSLRSFTSGILFWCHYSVDGLVFIFLKNTRKGPQKCHHKPDCSTVLILEGGSDWVYIQQGYSLCAISLELGSCRPESGLSPLVLSFREGSHLRFVLGHSPWQQCFQDERKEHSAD